MQYQNTYDFACEQDIQDPLALLSGRFHFPEYNGREALYFLGNSLGLQPRTAKDFITKELNRWADYGVEGYFMGDEPWMQIQEKLKGTMGKLMGALPHELVVMNTLTVNLHLLLVSFYRPTKERYKIICEGGAFPSDQYTFESQTRFHGYDPADAIIEIQPDNGELITTEHIINTIKKHAHETTLVMLGGINYYTGQLYDMKAITQAAKEAGITVGFDLAHVAGNVRTQLHDWGVDFAAWCTYKYLNSGPGGISGVFIHEKYANDPSLPRFAGWWGYEANNRFKMQKGFVPAHGAEGWQLSCTPALLMAPLRASLAIFEEAGIENIEQKRDLLTGYLEFILDELHAQYPVFTQITPRDKTQRGSHISISFSQHGRKIYEALMAEHVFVDWREPSVIRIAPVPLYNSFENIFELGKILKRLLETNF